MAASEAQRPRVLVTRRMMPDVEARAARVFQAALNPSDVPLTRQALIEQAQHHDALLLTSFDKFSADFIADLPPSIRIIATHSVGYDHLNIPLAKSRGIAVTNTPDVLTDATVHALGGEQDVRRMGGLRKRIPVTFWTFAIATAAIAGIPPLAGFFSKDEIL